MNSIEPPPQAIGAAARRKAGPQAPKEEDSALIRALLEYRAARETGQALVRQELLARYPEVGGELAACLDALDFVNQAAPKLEAAPLAAPAAVEATGAAMPLGDYRIVREVGRGGMGVVYEAEQISLGRRVALKVLPFAAALDPKQLQRFKNEAQAAAHLHHQQIVPVYSVGCERGVHYYAMQYIEGQTLAVVIQELRRLSGREGEEETVSAGPPAELAREMASGAWVPAKPSAPALTPTAPYVPLTTHHSPLTPTTPVAGLSTDRSTKSTPYFRTVAHLGVQAAEGLEHAHQLGVIHRDIKPSNLLVDTRGNLWVTDFGLAQVQGEAKLTMTGDVLGTIRYMSPEQALAQRAPVDHRTDVYSLGVTLYELLTLELAFSGRDRREVFRQIAFEEPRPPRRINDAIPKELETIVLKAMTKNPAERYATAQELADDLQRYLDDRPIRARRPTIVQRMRKWAWRNLAVVTAVGASVVVVLVLVAVLLSIGIVLLSRKQQETDAERIAATQAANRAEAVSQFLTSDLLGQASPDLNRRDKKVTVEQLLERAARNIDNTPKFAEQPDVEATLRLVIGNTYFKLGVLAEAEKHLRRAVQLRRDTFGLEDERTLAAQEDLADFLNRGPGKFDESEPLSRQTWQARRRVLGPEHPDTLNSMDTHATTLTIQNKLAEAETLYRQCYEARQRVLGKEDPNTLISLHNLSNVLALEGKWEDAEPLLRDCSDGERRVLGSEHMETLQTISTLGYVLTMQGGRQNLGEAARRLKEGLEVAQRVHGKENPLTFFLGRNLVLALTEQGRLDEAEALGVDSLSLHRRGLPAGHEGIGRALGRLGRVLTEKGRPAEAEPLLREAATLFRAHYPTKRDLIADSESWLGASVAALGRNKEAESLSLRSYDILKAAPTVPPRHKEAAKARIIKLYEGWGKPDKAAEWRTKQ